MMDARIVHHPWGGHSIAGTNIDVELQGDDVSALSREGIPCPYCFATNNPDDFWQNPSWRRDIHCAPFECSFCSRTFNVSAGVVSIIYRTERILPIEEADKLLQEESESKVE